MKTIPLTKNRVAFVDDADFAKVSAYKWRLHFNGSGYYARAYLGRVDGKQTQRYLHRFLVTPPVGYEVHHLDGDGLNNQRDNLAFVTRQHHLSIGGKRRPNKSGYRGVTKRTDKRILSFRVQIMQNRQHVYGASFKTAEEAARAYDAKARELFGPLAYQNFPAEAAKQRDRGAQNGDEP